MSPEPPAPSPLLQIVYVSLPKLETVMALDSVMADILAVSRSWNAAENITGMLVSNGYWFTQVLEGPVDAVDFLFRQIRSDPRHQEVTLRSRHQIAERRFGAWTMCGLTLSGLDDQLLSPPDIAFNIWDAEAGTLLQMMDGLATRYADALNAQHAGIEAQGPLKNDA